jgi:hypothetical protein
MDDIYIVSVRVTGADGRVSENQGAVAIGHLKADALANAVLKATTKAIRRAVLSHVGLGMLDETEVETIPEPEWNQWFKFQQKPPRHLAKSLQSLPTALL